MVIVVGFQIPVDGWLTKLSAPIVIYNEQHTSGFRFPFDIPVEDFLFGWAMVTAVLLLWERQQVAGEYERTYRESHRRRRSAGLVPAAFDAGAPAYDTLVNSNPGYHAHLRISAQRCGCPTPVAGYGCSTRAAAREHRRPHCSPSHRTPRSSPWTAQRACWTRRSAKQWPTSVRFVHSRDRGSSPMRVSTGPFDAIFAAYLVRNLPDPDAGLQAFRSLLRPGVHRSPYTNTRCATPDWPPRCGTRSAPRSSFRAAGCAVATPRCTGTCGEA